MKKTFSLFLIIIITCLNSPIHGMKRKKISTRPSEKNQIQVAPCIPEGPVAHIAGYCKPREKNQLMKVCKNFNTYLKKRTLILHENPFTVSLSDKIRSGFEYARSGNIKMIHFLLNVAQVNLNIKNRLGMTPFHYAMENNHQDIVELLIEHGANVHEPKPKIYPLHNAVYMGNKKYVKLLLKTRVNVNVKLENDATPLSIAIDEGHAKIEKLLRAAGAQKACELSFDEMMMQPISVEGLRAVINNKNQW